MIQTPAFRWLAIALSAAGIGAATTSTPAAAVSATGNFQLGAGPLAPGALIANTATHKDVPDVQTVGTDSSGTFSASQAISGDPLFLLPRLPADNPHYGFEWSLAPVPEPASLALMLGGLSLLGWRLRRRDKAGISAA